MLREKKEREEAAALRAGAFTGYQDIVAGRVTEYTGDLRAMLDAKRTPPVGA